MNRVLAQIDRYRKGAAVIQVQDRHGQPQPGVCVSVEQETHQFLFGCIVSDLGDFSAHERERYHRRVGEVFNVIRRCDQDERADADVLTVDFSRCDQRMHLAQVQRQLDGVKVSPARGRGKDSLCHPQVHVYVSGKTIGMCDFQRSYGRGVGDDNKAAQQVASFYTLCFSHPVVRGVFWRGVSDREEGVSAGGLLRTDLSPKHAHKSLRKLIHAIWHTRDHGETDALGQFRFRGFFGRYRVVATTQDTKAVIGHLHLREERQENAITLTLTGDRL